MRHCFAVLALTAMALFLNGCNHDNDSSDDGGSGGGCANGHCHQHHHHSTTSGSHVGQTTSDGWTIVSETTTTTQASPSAPSTPTTPQIPVTIHVSDPGPAATVALPVPADPATVAPPIAPAGDNVPAPAVAVTGEDPGSDTPDDLNFSDSKGHIARKAVIVGINNYPDARLEGCVNDAKDMLALATTGLKVKIEPLAGMDNSKAGEYVSLKGWGYKRSNVKFLVDSDATTKNLRSAYAWLTKGTLAGDKRLNTYSGHGAEDAISPDAAHEPDHLNQLMCPQDFDWSREHMLIDKDLVSIFAQMPPGVTFNWLSDSCHSGDLDKKIWKRKVHLKTYPNTPGDVTARIAKVKARAEKNAQMHRGMIDGHLDVGFLSGCKSDQTSADSSDSDGRPCGACTHFFIQVYARNPNATVSEIAATMDKVLSADDYEQQPMAEGPQAGKPWQP